jgi:hypothetical protein
VTTFSRMIPLDRRYNNKAFVPEHTVYSEENKNVTSQLV